VTSAVGRNKIGLAEHGRENRHKSNLHPIALSSRVAKMGQITIIMKAIFLLLLVLTAVTGFSAETLGDSPVSIQTSRRQSPSRFHIPTRSSSVDAGTTGDALEEGRPQNVISSIPRQRRLQGSSDYYKDVDVESLEEGLVLGVAFILVIIILCLLCCCLSMCCRGRGGGGGSGCLTDILALFCCYELFCDDSPGCGPCGFVPMDTGMGGEMC
jgi:hypothetical protein